jgi:hypothetical protein
MRAPSTTDRISCMRKGPETGHRLKFGEENRKCEPNSMPILSLCHEIRGVVLGYCHSTLFLRLTANECLGRGACAACQPIRRQWSGKEQIER